jgi:hypothetical protein
MAVMVVAMGEGRREQHRGFRIGGNRRLVNPRR